jgi:hypothetical protein
MRPARSSVSSTRLISRAAPNWAGTSLLLVWIYLSAGQSEVIALAENGRVKRLPVVSGGKIVGMIIVQRLSCE